MTSERHAELMELGKKATAISGFWESSEGMVAKAVLTSLAEVNNG